MTEPTSSESLRPAEQEFLRTLAWQGVETAVSGLPAPDPLLVAKDMELVPGPVLLENRGAFVTLTQNRMLRGCIGYIEGIKPLMQAVVENAASAAVGDPRFRPVTPEEIPTLDLEISVLSPLQSVPGPSDIIVGTHGILLDKDGRRSVFLPQVAGEQGWDLETTLTHLALKAGLPADAWRDGAQFQVFTALVF